MKLANLKAKVSKFVKNNTKFVAGFSSMIGCLVLTSICCVTVATADIEDKPMTMSSSESIVTTSPSSISNWGEQFKALFTTTTTSVTTTVTTTTTTTTTTTKVTKSVADIAKEVINGKFGNGEERKKKLEKAGYDYEKVQKEVNKLMSGEVTTTTVSNSNQESTSNDDSYYDDYEDNNYSSDDNSSEDNNSSYVSNSTNGTTYVKHFSRGTYYSAGYGGVGGSGRTLIDCSYGDGSVHGSIASSYLYYTYGYFYSGGRTMVYLDVHDFPSMSGYYYLDDCDAGNSEVIDFYFYDNYNSPFQYQGVLTDIDCYIVG